MIEMTVIQAQTTLLRFQTKLGLFKFALQRKDFKHFSNLLQLEKDGSIVDRDLEIYAKHLRNLNEDFEGTLCGPIENTCAGLDCCEI